jgi:hypothetical protein
MKTILIISLNLMLLLITLLREEANRHLPDTILFDLFLKLKFEKCLTNQKSLLKIIASLDKVFGCKSKSLSFSEIKVLKKIVWRTHMAFVSLSKSALKIVRLENVILREIFPSLKIKYEVYNRVKKS